MKKCLLLFLINFVHLIFAQEVSLKKPLFDINTDKLNSSKIIEIEKTLLKSPDDAFKVETLYTLGKVFSRLEKYDKAFDSFTKALAVANEIKSTVQIAIVNEAIGNLYFKLGKFDKSEVLYKISLANYTKINDANGIAKAKGNLALIDIKKGHIDQAISSLIALSKFENLDAVSKSIALMSVGNVYLEKRLNPVLAISYYQQSIALLNKIENADLICNINQNIAESYINLKQYDKALAYNKKSELFLNTQNNNELSATLYLFYSKIAEGQAKPELALKNYKTYKEYEKRVDASKNLLLIENLEIISQLKNKEIQDKIQEQEIKILKTEKSLATTKIYLLILLVLIIGLSIYSILKKQKIKVNQLHNTVIQSQNKLTYTENKTEKIILNVQHNNDFITAFTYRLKEILADLTDEKVKKNLNSLIFELQSGKLPNKKNEELFEDISSTFMYNLEKNYPTITEEERKICALIFLNYKNKEIATSLNLSIRSVENHRYRIRKKMNIETNISLYAYFQQLI